MDLPTYTNIWRIEKKLYKLYDFRLPQPVSVVYIGVVVGVGFVWVMLLRLIGVPLEMPLHVVYIVPPFVIAFLATRPVVEGKRLSELVVSQIRFMAEPRVFTRLRPEREPAAIEVTVRVWHRDPEAGPLPAVAADAGVRERARERGAERGRVPGRRTSTGPNRTAGQAPSLAGALPSAPLRTGGPAEAEETAPEPLWDDEAVAAPKATANGSRPEPPYSAARPGGATAVPLPPQESEPEVRDRGAYERSAGGVDERGREARPASDREPAGHAAAPGLLPLEPEPAGASASAAPAPTEPPDLRGDWERDDDGEPQRGARRRGIGLRVLNYFGFALDRRPGHSTPAERRADPAPGTRRRPARGPVSGPVPGAARTPVELAEHLAAAERPAGRERGGESPGTAAPVYTADTADAPAFADRPASVDSSARRRAEEMMAAPAPAEPAPSGAAPHGAEGTRPAAERDGAAAAAEGPQRRLRGRAQGMEVARRLERERSVEDASARPARGDGAPAARPSLRERRAQRRPHAAPWDLPVPLAGADSDRPDGGEERRAGAEPGADGVPGHGREQVAPVSADSRSPVGAAQDGPWAAAKPALELDHGTGEHENLSGVLGGLPAHSATDAPSAEHGRPSTGDEDGGAADHHGPEAAPQNGSNGEAKPQLQLDHGTDEHESLSGVVRVFSVPQDGGAPERTDPGADPGPGDAWAAGSGAPDPAAAQAGTTGTAEARTADAAAEPEAAGDAGSDTGDRRADGEGGGGRDDGRAGGNRGAGGPSGAPGERLSVLDRHLSRTDTPAPRPPRFAEAGGHEPRRPVAWFTDAADPHGAPAAAPGAPGIRPDPVSGAAGDGGRSDAGESRGGEPASRSNGHDSDSETAGSAGRDEGGEPVGGGASGEGAPTASASGPSGGRAERADEVARGGGVGSGESPGGHEAASDASRAAGADTAVRREPAREDDGGHRTAERSGHPDGVAGAAGYRDADSAPSRGADVIAGTGDGGRAPAERPEAGNTPVPSSGLPDPDPGPAVGRQSLPPLAGPPLDTGRTPSLRGDASAAADAPEEADSGAPAGRAAAPGAERSAAAAQGPLPPLAGAPEESGANAPVRGGAAEDTLQRGREPGESGARGRDGEGDRQPAAAAGTGHRTGASAAAASVAVPAKPPLELDHGTGEHESFGQVDAPHRRTTAADLEAAEAAAIRSRAGRAERTGPPGDADRADEPARAQPADPADAASGPAGPGRAAVGGETADTAETADHPDRSDRLARTIRSSPTGGSAPPARAPADDRDGDDDRDEGGPGIEPGTAQRRMRSAPAARVDDGVFSRVAQNARRLSHLFGQTPPGTPPESPHRTGSTPEGGTAEPPAHQAAERPRSASSDADKPELQLDHGTGEQEGMGRTGKSASSQRDQPTGPASAAPGDSGATRGWRRLARVVTGGSAAATKSDLPAGDIERLRTPLPSPRNVVVLGCTGGAGQTATTLMLGHTLAAYRDERVVAVDVNPGGGGLSRRIRTETPETVTSLLANADSVHGYAGMRRYTSRAATGLEVVATLDDPYVQTLDDRDYAGLAGLLERFYEITVLDPAATGVARSLPAADGMVLVAPASEDAARAVAMTFEWLDGHGYSALRSTAVVVINGVSKRSLADVDAAEQVARGRCRAIVRVPWDDHLAAGKVVDVGALRPTTRRAHGALGGVLVRGMDGGTAPSGRAAPGGRRRSPSETRG
ncbi:TcpE family conjugal transfer membrane protein [Streptomonospora wellingtoniae]|uniref:TcpE family conjugal transfer membrane protein n=1 Tax=Streptomonospora wellingtoniae TaxID=3075544 RepID=A0ABU2L0Q8_9ACTN|nr:TcpE family conjugal transfer membrane protein [Streptomonospora sp. DSM 45055]MDT0304838.1 TcpE family conjugal transfer membrane protein [Streptomonospora sp. DSM 45055]